MSDRNEPRTLRLPHCQLCGATPISEEHAVETQRRWMALMNAPAWAAQGAAPLDYTRRMREAVYHAVVALTSDQKEGGTRYPIRGGPGIPEQPTYAHSAMLIEEKVIEPLYEFARDETRTRDGFPDPASELAAPRAEGLPLAEQGPCTTECCDLQDVRHIHPASRPSDERVPESEAGE